MVAPGIRARRSPGPARAARILGAGLALLLLAPAVPAGDAKLAKARCEALLAALDELPSPATLAALTSLATCDHPLAVDALLTVLAQGSPCFHAAARRVLSGYTSAESVERLVERGLGHRNPGVRAQVLDALAEGRHPGVDWIGRAVAALGDDVAEVRAAAVTALGKGRRAGDLPAVVAAAGDPSERVRAATPAALVRLAPRRALPVLAELADDTRWRVRAAVIAAVVELRTREGTALLVGRLTREPGRLREDLQAALLRLTGHDYGVDPESWQAFLAQAPDDFLAQGDLRATGTAEPARQTVASYYGLSTHSQRLVMITDLSTSMETVDGGRYAGTDRSRLERTRDELASFLDALTPEVAFNLVTFSDGVQAWERGLVPADDRRRTAALREVSRYACLGGTNLEAALSLVFDEADADLDTPRGNGPDTVFLLTDGAPSLGALVDPSLLLAYAAERNRHLGLRFQCVSLATDSAAREFLAELATSTGGRSVTPGR